MLLSVCLIESNRRLKQLNTSAPVRLAACSSGAFMGLSGWPRAQPPAAGVVAGEILSRMASDSRRTSSRFSLSFSPALGAVGVVAAAAIVGLSCVSLGSCRAWLAVLTLLAWLEFCLHCLSVCSLATSGALPMGVAFNCNCLSVWKAKEKKRLEFGLVGRTIN